MKVASLWQIVNPKQILVDWTGQNKGNKTGKVIENMAIFFSENVSCKHKNADEQNMQNNSSRKTNKSVLSWLDYIHNAGFAKMMQ